MAAPYHNLRSKLNRAISAWLIENSCGTSADIFTGFTVKDRSFPCTTVKATVGHPSPVFSGNYSIRVHIVVKGSAAQTHGQDAELARVIYDDRLAKTNDALMQTEDGTSLRFTAQSITSAGRALVPTSFVLYGAGTAAVNGKYSRVNATQWDKAGGDYSAVFISGDGAWHIYNFGAVVQYSCLTDNFPFGPWITQSASDPAPNVKRADNWDMADFSIIQWVDAGFGESEAEDDGCDWSETLLFDAICCPSNVGGYSLTD